MKQIIDALKELTEFQSTSNKPKENLKCLQLIERLFSDDFFITKYSFQSRPMVVLSNTKDKKVDFILAGHIDVVPAEDNQFQMKIEKGKLFGRGVFDMKGPLLAGIFAISDFLKQNKNLKITIFITSDEEIDGLSVKYLLDSEGYKADFAIIPDGGKETGIVIEQKGFLQVKMKVYGKPAHASRPWEAENPIMKGLDFVNQLFKKFEQPKFEQDWKNSIALTRIESGKALNQIPQECDICLDIRYISEEYKERILEEIKNILKNEGEIEIIAENSAFKISEDNVFLKALKRAIEGKTKKGVELIRECATSDAVFFTENGIPAVLFRPKGGGEHAANEWVDEKSLFVFYEILLDFLYGFGGYR